MRRSNHQFIRYSIVILLGFAVDIACAGGVLEFGVPIELAAVIGIVCGAFFNYVLLKFYVFKGAKNTEPLYQPLRYLAALAATIAIRVSAVWLLVTILPAGIPQMICLLGGVIISSMTNFFLSKYWVFRTDKMSFVG